MKKLKQLKSTTTLTLSVLVLCTLVRFSLASDSCMNPVCPNFDSKNDLENAHESKVKSYITALKGINCQFTTEQVKKLSKFMVSKESSENDIQEFYEFLVPKIAFKSESVNKTLKEIEENNTNTVFSEEKFWKFFSKTKVCDYEKTVTYLTQNACSKQNKVNNNLALYMFNQSIQYSKRKVDALDFFLILNECAPPLPLTKIEKSEKVKKEEKVTKEKKRPDTDTQYIQLLVGIVNQMESIGLGTALKLLSKIFHLFPKTLKKDKMERKILITRMLERVKRKNDKELLESFYKQLDTILPDETLDSVKKEIEDANSNSSEEAKEEKEDSKKQKEDKKPEKNKQKQKKDKEKQKSKKNKEKSKSFKHDDKGKEHKDKEDKDKVDKSSKEGKETKSTTKSDEELINLYLRRRSKLLIF